MRNDRRAVLGSLTTLGSFWLAGCSTVSSGSADQTVATSDDAATDETTPSPSPTESATSSSRGTKLVPDDGTDGGLFGSAVALSGDTAVITAYETPDESADYRGAAYTFERTDGEWRQEGKLPPDDEEFATWIGPAVAYSGDTALVCGGGKDDRGSRTVVYAFRRSDDGWHQQSRVEFDGANVGSAVAVDDDLAVVTAAEGTVVHALARRDGDWEKDAQLELPSSEPERVSIESAAVDGTTALVGACHRDDGLTVNGPVCVFERADAEWRRQATLTPTDAPETVRFGYSVGLAGDTAVVGAPHGIPRDFYTGSAYAFERDGDEWSEAATLVPEEGEASDGGGQLGDAVALSDGAALVGAYNAKRDGEVGTGEAFVFDTDSWTVRERLTAPDGDKNDHFGDAVAVDAGTALVSADDDEDPNGDESGSAYVFDV